MEFDTILLGLRLVFHFGIFLAIASYHPKGSRQRWGVSSLAVAMASSNFGLGMALSTGAIEPRAIGPQWLYAVAFGSLFWLVLLCRGNMARMLPGRHSSEEVH